MQHPNQQALTPPCRAVKALVVAAGMRLKQRAFQEAAVKHWVARARDQLAFRRRRELDQARAMLDRTFSSYELQQV